MSDRAHHEFPGCTNPGPIEVIVGRRGVAAKLDFPGVQTRAPLKESGYLVGKL